MNMGLDYLKIMQEEARLIILRALADQTNESLSSSMLEPVLMSFGINQTRAWLHQQLDYLANMDAVRVTTASTIQIATLTELGRRHVDRLAAIEGVKRPSRIGS